MKMLTAIAVFAACTVAAWAAAASEWWVADLTHGQAFFIDRSSISQSLEGGKSVRQAWVSQYSREPGKDGSSINKTLFAFDCAGNNISVRSSVSYTKDGNVIDSWSIRKDLIEFSPIVPDSTGQAWSNFVCRYDRTDISDKITLSGRTYYRVSDIDAAAKILLDEIQ